ncbi:MAG TPA: DUF4386 domain-containing protein [Candidatus Eisenbacteria bacterium]|nr:DUF4386 domain-containing protein [Candidatus Eisenbacteria bacterium]
MDSIKKQARFAGFLYLLVGVTAPIGLMVVPARLIVSGDATATIARIRASEWLLHAGIASELIHQTIGILLVLALFRLFKPVNVNQAALMVIFSLLPIPIVFLNVVHEIGALTLISGADFLSVFDQRHLEALAYFFLRLHGRGILVASIFWGLWLIPFGVCVWQSRFIPRFLAVLMWIGAFGYLLAAVNTLMLPRAIPMLGQIAGICEIGELPIMVWLLFWGAREQRGPARAPAAA